MPINYQQAAEQIHALGEKARSREVWLQELRAEARRLFEELAGELDYLRDLAVRAERLNPRLRCAVPLEERLDAALGVATPDGPFVLLAADGSQINPDRHGAVEFGAINVGAIRMRPGVAPRELVVSKLFFGEELYDNKRPLTEADLAIWRDLEERKMLFAMAREESESGLRVATLTDGPLELYSMEQDTEFFKQKLEEYLSILRELSGLRAAAAGYVDKPRSDTLVALLELAVLERNGELSQAGRDRPLWPVRDRDLLLERLQPGQRSAVLELRSPAGQRFTGQLGLHFFYLNVGRIGRAQLARVEIPRWVALDRELLDLLHAALLVQAAQMGARPYPYILHRAHEVAVVHLDERDQLESMIQAELRRRGLDVGEKSNKQTAKDLEGRTRI